MFDVARAELLRVSGTQFDPAAIEVFLAEEATLREMVERKCAVASLELPPAAGLHNSRQPT